MGYNNIKRVLSAALLLAFINPSTLAVTDSTYYGIRQSDNNSMTFNSGVSLTDKNEKITLSLRDSDIKQVLRMFADKAGMNIVFHNSVDGKVTLDLVDTPINEAFNLVLSIGNLNYYKQGNTMVIMSKNADANAAYSKQEMMIFPVKYVSAVSIANFLNKNVFSMQKPGMSGTDAATVNSATNELIVFGMPSDAAIVKKVIEQFDREPYTRTFSVNHTTPAEMASMICDLLLPSRGMNSDKNSSTGGAAGIITGAAAAVSGNSDTLKLGEGIVACTMGSTANGSVAPFDVQNLSIAYFPQRGTITLMGGSEAQAKMIESFIKANDVKQPQAYLEVQIVELNEDGSKEFNNQWGLYSKHWQATFDGQKFSGGHEGPGNLTSTYYPTKMYTDKYDAKNVLTGQNVFDYMFPMSSGIKISWMMQYLIQNRKGRVLANPKILITNGQESVIDLTQDYVEKVDSEFLSAASNGVSSVGTVQREYSIGSDLGIKISLVPFISPEGYVTLNIKPNYSTVADQVYAANSVGGTDLAATLLSRRDLDLKNVRIKDGETLVIGGMLQEKETKSVSKIPFLGDIPFVGAAFRSTQTSKTKTELVIMITPNIINDGEGAIADSI